jgi:hypothetical protein
MVIGITFLGTSRTFTQNRGKDKTLKFIKQTKILNTIYDKKKENLYFNINTTHKS